MDCLTSFTSHREHSADLQLFGTNVAFALCGLWHGPAWNFVVWGLFHGLGIIVANAYRKIPFGVGRVLETTFRRAPLLGWALTLMFVWVGWLLFFYPVDTALKMAISLFRFKIAIKVTIS